MRRFARPLLLLVLSLAAGVSWASWWVGPRSLLARVGLAATTGRAEAAARRVSPRLRAQFEAAGLRWGAPLLLRIFKLEHELELWVQRDDRFELFRNYPICAWSGRLGPKLRQGDRQAPEGFYRVAPAQLNPASQYHLSFDLGYPNAYDRAMGRSGDFLMVHGSCVSVGCYAMGDAGIEEIYTLLGAAFDAGQAQVEVHAFPFRFDRTDRGERLADPQWGPFWRELAQGSDLFERERRPPRVSVRDGHYVVTAP